MREPVYTEDHQKHTRELCEGLRALAAFFEKCPPPNYERFNFNLFVQTKEDFVDLARRMGSFEKTSDGSYYMIVKKFSQWVTLEWNIRHDKICEKRVTTQIIPAEPEHVVPAKPEREEEIVEWICPESILRHEADPFIPGSRPPRSLGEEYGDPKIDAAMPTDQRIAEAIADEMRTPMPPRFINCIRDEEIVPTGADDDGGTIPVG